MVENDINIDDKQTWFARLVIFLTLLTAISLSFIGIFLPPTGIIDGSVLILIAEFLVFIASILGVKTANLQIMKKILELKKVK